MAEVILEDSASISEYGLVPLQFWPVRAFVGFFAGMTIATFGLTIFMAPLMALGISRALLLYSSLFTLAVTSFSMATLAGFSSKSYAPITMEEAFKLGLIENSASKNDPSKVAGGADAADDAGAATIDNQDNGDTESSNPLDVSPDDQAEEGSAR